MAIIFMNMENSKTNEPHKPVVKLSQRLYLRSSDKRVVIYLLHVKKYKGTV